MFSLARVGEASRDDIVRLIELGVWIDGAHEDVEIQTRCKVLKIHDARIAGPWDDLGCLMSLGWQAVPAALWGRNSLSGLSK